MADIFDEVGDDLRREKLNRFWQGYGALIIGIAVLIVLAVAGWRIWDYYATSRAAAAGDAYTAALKGAETDHLKTAEALLAFAADAPGDYALLARFRAASEKAAAGEVPGAIAAFEGLSTEAGLPGELKDFAKLRAAMLAVDTEDRAAVEARLKPLTDPNNPWRTVAGELMAVTALKAKDYAGARTQLDAIAGDPLITQDVRSRIEILRAIVDAELGPAAAKAPETGS